MTIRRYVLLSLASFGITSSLLFATVGVASAQTGTMPTQGQGGQAGHQGDGLGGGRGHMMGRMPGVFGTVSAVNGTTLTVTSKAFGPHATSSTQTAATYTVDASSATVTKDGSSSSVSAIAVGDTVMIEGTVSGSSVTAKEIRDGMPAMNGTPGDKSSGGSGMKAPDSIITGNGQPVIGGSVSAINGSTLTVTNKSNVAYSVDASNAMIEKGHATSSVSAITLGDNVIVQGSVSGQSVTASSVLDQGAAATPAGSGAQGAPKAMGGVFGAIGGFFQRLFGFF